VAPTVLSSLPDRLNEERLSVSVSEHIERYIYNHLEPWQTRILCLYPSGCSSDGRDVPLSADLMVVTVSDAEDFLISPDGAAVKYTALSYSWGRPALNETLTCNGKAMPISWSNAAALVALRKSSEPTYVWIDAICINQEDALEKSAQVARMLKIYRKAQSVTVWLGEPDADSLLAFAFIQEFSRMKQDLVDFKKTTHIPDCHAELRQVLRALLRFFERPWLRRTWIRQEIYGARRLDVHCGSQQVSWDDYIRAADLMEAMQSLAKDEEVTSGARIARHRRLVTEALRNASLPPSGVKHPRDLADALLQTCYFEATDPRDTFYGILGMCNVEAVSKEATRRSRVSKSVVVVDYTKSLVEVYHDATLCILHRKGKAENLASLWHSYKRGNLHTSGLPLWAVDWQSGTSDDGATLELIGSRPLPTDRTLMPADPNNLYKRFIMTNEATDPSRAWYWPEPLSSDAKVLHLRARALNYVAYLTDFTCDPVKFLGERPEEDFEERPEHLGSTGWAIHCQKILRDPFVGHAIVYPAPEWEEFNPQKHSLRLAILGVGNDSQLCLVSSTTKKGDLIVAIAPGLFAMAISPMQGDGTAGGLIPEDDPYEEVKKEASRVCHPWKAMIFLCDYAAFFSLPVMMAPFPENEHASDSMCLAFTLSFGVILVTFFFEYLMGYYCRPITGSYPCLRVYGDLFFVVATACVFLFLGETYIGMAAGAFATMRLWRIYQEVECHVSIASRRIKVSRTLNNAREMLGHDYGFCGPVFVRYYDRRRVSGDGFLFLFLKLRFAIATLLTIRSSERKALKAYFLEMWESVDRDGNESWGGGYVWDRPIQNFNLR
jgi:hypothetical protein